MHMIARLWRGTTRAADADRYFQYLLETGLKDYRSIPGNRGVYTLRKIGPQHAEFLLISLWDSFDAIQKFAGPEYEKAVYYPEDAKFLLEMEPNVTHYELLPMRTA
jgi:heme-degrading monooxygenase HmoA